MPRWGLACDTCGARGWIGPRRAGGSALLDAWCEGCQTPHALKDPPAAEPVCPRCGTALTVDAPRFEELLGEAQNIAAVLAAWCGDPEPLARLLPDRPRFLTDLDPPAPRPGDPEGGRRGLEALARGEFARARRALAAAARVSRAAGHLWRGLGIAAQRLGDLAQAEEAFARALAADPHDSAARLDRGALRARRADFAGAREDFALAGDRREARWNRAALRVLEAVAATPGLPDPATLEQAREEAGEPSSYWSDHTVGRLLWTLVVERARSRQGPDAACPDERVLRAAERELEFDTFWDRALVVHGYAALGMKYEAGASAAALAREGLARLAGEPFARGPASGWLVPALGAARAAVEECRPGDALAALASVMERADVRRYRVPCLACGRGALGVESCEEEGGG